MVTVLARKAGVKLLDITVTVLARNAGVIGYQGNNSGMKASRVKALDIKGKKAWG